MATQEMYDKVKNLTRQEIVSVAQECCGDGCNDDYCENECPYLDVREEEQYSPIRFCRQWVMHDLLQIIRGER